MAKGEFEEALQRCLRERLAEAPRPLAEAIRYSLLAPDRHLRPGLLLAASQMMSVPREAALPAAISLEMIRCSELVHDDLPSLENSEIDRGQPASHKKFGEAMALLAGDALVPLAIELFLEAAPHVETENFFQAMRRLALCAGHAGVIGGQAERRELSAESTLDDLKRINTKRTGSLFSAAILVPKDLAGIPDDSSQGLALDIFARELGLAFQAMNDFKSMGGKDIAPSHILYYLPAKEARSMILQRLNSATLSLSSAWGAPSRSLVQIAEEITREIQASADT